MTCNTPVSLEEIVKKLSYANNELIFKNSREKAVELFKSITVDLCSEKSSEDKITVKAIHNRKTILVDLQVEKSRINDWWLVTMTPYL
jgi:hypothetical protein